jgi:hypothetical protein
VPQVNSFCFEQASKLLIQFNEAPTERAALPHLKDLEVDHTRDF